MSKEMDALDKRTEFTDDEIEKDREEHPVMKEEIKNQATAKPATSKKRDPKKNPATYVPKEITPWD